jgi:predicted permease
VLKRARYAFRSLRKTPGFTAAAVATLALGIGANTIIFSVLQGVVLAPLPFHEPNRLVLVSQVNLTLKRELWVSYLDARDWQRTARSFDQTALAVYRGFDLTSPGTPEHVEGRLVSAGFFRTLGVKMAAGREFSLDEDRPHGAPVALIGDRLWRNRFSGSRNALGKSIALNGVDYTITGVLPRDFRLWIDAAEADVYTPLGQGDPIWIRDRTIHPGIAFIARLKPGVTIAHARAEMDAVQSHLNQLYPAEDRGLGTDVMPLKHAIVGDVSGTLLLLLGAVGLVLLIACANVANLLMARSEARSREFAIRAALGASRSSIASQLVAESALLSLAGGILGVVIASQGVGPALAAIAGNLPRAETIGVNIPVLLFTFAVSITVGILFGLAPGLKSSKTDLQEALKAGGRIAAGGRHRSQHVLIVGQIALTLVLLTGASLLFRTIQNLWQVNPGFNTQQIITFKVGLAPALTRTPLSTRVAYQQLAARIGQIPGVRAADLTALIPLSRQGNGGPFWVGPHPPASNVEAPRAEFFWTGPDYARTMEIPVLQGRYLTPQDTINSEPVVVIDSDLARAYFGDRSPVGQPIEIPHWGTARIVGVVGHVRHWGLDDVNLYTQNQIYASFYQLADAFVPVFTGDMTFVVRTPLDPSTVLPAIKAAVYGAGGGQPVYNVQTMRQIVTESMTPQRFPMILLGTFAGLALLLACVGIYGVMSYAMSQRVREVGIRMALGAEKRDVLRMVIGQGLRLAVTGIAIGAVGALVLARVLSSFSHLLYGVGPEDPLIFMAVSLALIGAAVLACYLPAQRAARLDPMAALRQE